MPADVSFSFDLGPRRVFLRELHQSFTYESLLDGRPTTWLNDRLLEAARTKAQALHPLMPVVLLPPPVTSDITSPQIPARFGHHESLPAVRCTGRFVSPTVVRNDDEQFSGLVVVWFQPAFAFPIASDVIAALASLDWAALADDFSL